MTVIIVIIMITVIIAIIVIIVIIVILVIIVIVVIVIIVIVVIAVIVVIVVIIIVSIAHTPVNPPEGHARQVYHSPETNPRQQTPIHNLRSRGPGCGTANSQNTPTDAARRQPGRSP